MDNRIGTINADGSRTWPKVDILGQAYEKPASTVDLDAARFVVIPINFNQPALIEELKAAYQQPDEVILAAPQEVEIGVPSIEAYLTEPTFPEVSDEIYPDVPGEAPPSTTKRK